MEKNMENLYRTLKQEITNFYDFYSKAIEFATQGDEHAANHYLELNRQYGNTPVSKKEQKVIMSFAINDKRISLFPKNNPKRI